MSLFKGNEYAISYTIYGEGIPVVLLHGFGEDSTIFNHEINDLKENCKLIIPNIPGTGKSVLNFEQQEATIEFFADCIKQFLDSLKVDKCILLGHSMGGYITLAFAEQFPNSLYAFGLIHSTTFSDSEEKKVNRLKGIEIMRKYGAASFLRTTFPNLFSEEFKTEKLDKLKDLINHFSYISTDTCVYYYQAMIARKDKTFLLKKTPLQVLFVVGEEDIAAPMADVLKQISLPTYSSVHILPNVGHMSMVEAPEKLNKILLDFLKEVQVEQTE